MKTYTVFDNGEIVANGVKALEVAEITGICLGNVSDYARNGRIRGGRFQVCCSNDSNEPKDLSNHALWRNEWDAAISRFKNVQWGKEGKKLKISKHK